MAFLYNFIIHVYLGFIYCFRFFDRKAFLWVKGRQRIFERLRKEFGGDDRIAWFHAASLGEFEQGRPIIEEFRKRYPGYKILLTFFSPSGYEIRKDYEGADYIYYLPFDTRANARKFVDTVRPSFAFFIKYEYWFNILTELHSRNIPVYIISAVFRPQQYFFRWYGRWFRDKLKDIPRYFVQDRLSLELLNHIGIHQVTLSGDTRFDRVFKIASEAGDFPIIEKFKGNSLIILAGSTWPSDEAVLIRLIRENIPGLKFLIVPHEVYPKRIENLLSSLPARAAVYSRPEEEAMESAGVMVVDHMGILSELYRYADIAYVGGGFGRGIHNVLEAAAFGKPVIIGPKYSKFLEARELIALQGVFSVHSSPEMIHRVRLLLENQEEYQRSAEACASYIEEKKGATEVVLGFVSDQIQ